MCCLSKQRPYLLFEFIADEVHVQDFIDVALVRLSLRRCCSDLSAILLDCKVMQVKEFLEIYRIGMVNIHLFKKKI